MNRLLLAALTFAVAGSAATAQQAERHEIPQMNSPYLEPSTPEVRPSVAAEEQRYGYNTVLGYFRPYMDEQGVRRDSNRIDLPVPFQIGNAATGIQVRGIGQIFAPKYLHALLSGTVYNKTSKLIRWEEGSEATDQDYIDQFKNAGAFRIENLSFLVWKNFTQTMQPTSSPAAMIVYKTNTNFTGQPYRTNGFSVDPNSLESVFETEYLPEGIDTTLEVVGTGGQINQTVIVFDEPLEFADGESAVFMYQNTEAAVGDLASDDIQTVRLFLETPPNKNRRPIEGFRTFGVALIRNAMGLDSIQSLYRAINLTGPPAVPLASDAVMFFGGSVDLGPSGVRYHFGTEAGGQGVGEVTPNPVSTDTRIPFTLTERANISLDLFATGGQHVRNLVTATYVPGVYSAPLNVGDLENGTYLVRLTAGTKVYTQKLIVNK